MSDRRVSDTLMSRYCEVPGCGERSREGKNVCAEHLSERPYVKRILADLAAIDDEEEALRKQPTTNLTSLLMQEVVRTCQLLGAVTPERLARERDLHPRAAYNALRSLVMAGLAREGTNRRGSTAFRWLGPPVAR